MNDQVLGHKKLLAVEDGKPLYKKALELLRQAKAIFDEGLYFEGQEPSGRADIEDTVLMHVCDDLDARSSPLRALPTIWRTKRSSRPGKWPRDFGDRAGFPAH